MEGYDIPSDELKKTYKTFVFAGGGIKGYGLGPMLRMQDELGIYNKIENVIGSSVGGLTASMMALGMNAVELENYLKTGGQGLMDIFSTPEIFKAPSEKLSAVGNLMATRSAAAKGHTLFHAAQAAVADSLGNPNATFADLEKLAGQDSKSGGKYRNLMLTVTVSDKRGSYQIVCSPKTTPNMPIALAMRMTASLPIAFPPVKLSKEQIEAYTAGATEPLVQYYRETPQRNVSRAKEYVSSLLPEAPTLPKVDLPKIPFDLPKVPFQLPNVKMPDMPEVKIPQVTIPEAFPEFPPFPFYVQGSFNLASPEEKEKIINDIKNDLLQNSLNTEGDLECTDGGVVENLPIYLAIKKESGLDQTIAFDFEDNPKRNGRESNKHLYAADKNIDPAAEIFYRDVALNPSSTDWEYYHMQRTVHESRLPENYQLRLLQKNNLIALPTDDIKAADFELATDNNKTHDQKVTHLLYHGYNACAKFLNSKGVQPLKSFFEMYPEEQKKAQVAYQEYEERKKAEPKSIFSFSSPSLGVASSIKKQIEKNENSIACWEKIIGILMAKTHGEKHDVIEFLYNNMIKMREYLQEAKNINFEREGADSALDFLFQFAKFTEENLQLIIDAKKKGDKLFNETVEQLSLLEKAQFKNLDKSQKTINELKDKNPGLAETYDKLFKLQESSIFFEELLKLIRDESVVAKKEQPHRPKVLSEHYRSQRGSPPDSLGSSIRSSKSTESLERRGSSDSFQISRSASSYGTLSSDSSSLESSDSDTENKKKKSKEKTKSKK